MKLSRRILSAFLAVLMVCSVVTAVGAASVTFTDVYGHWAWTGGQIQYLVDKGVLNGYKQPNGTYTFNPDGQVTRAEFIKMLDETFGLTATANISFSDVKTTDWFYPYFAKAEAQGYLLNYGKSVNPNGKITREEALSLLVRYLDLPANEKSDTSYFADYNTISENFRDYVLRGVYAGLTDGYNEGGVKIFKPKNTLTRAEALTILYRAAGCIFNLNAYSRDNNAAATNNVITRGGVILNGINLTGRVIISEGANSGTVSLSGCSVNDTLYVRGTADVTLDDCKIENIVITNGCKLSLLNGTEVDNIVVYGKSTLGVYSGITLGVLDVENGANNTTVTGDGAIRMAYINASGFSSSMVPSEFQIGNNLTASFASTQYQGSSDAQESFTMTPFVTSDDANYYLNLFPAVDGDVYYYFTNGSVPPTTASFDSYYDSSSFTGVISVEAGEILTEKTYSAGSVKNFEYVVLQLQEGGRKYAPVMVPNTNTDGSGFSTHPYLADETTIKFVAAEAGTLYWFYAKSGEKLTQAEFLQAYANTDSALRDSNNIASDRTLSLALSTKYLKNYDYVVLMLKNGAGSYYSPVVVSAGDTGFAEVPTLKSVGVVSFKPSVSGDLYYYFSETDDLPAPADFKGEYNNAEYADNMKISKNSADTFTYSESRSEDYPYLILAIRNSDKDYMQPVLLDINFRTGFAVEPEIVDETTIRFKTEDDGEVMYYYSKSETAPTLAKFYENYNDAANSRKDTMDVDDRYEYVNYSQQTAATYPYMVFLFIDDQEKEYTPIVLELDAASETGFLIDPYVTDEKVYFKVEGPGEVWYYYAKTQFSVASSEFEDDYDDAYEYGSVDVDGGSLEYFELEDDDVIDRYPYIVVAFLPEDEADEEDKKFSFPIVVDIEDAEMGGYGLVVDIVDSDRVYITTQLDGELYYYFSDSSSVTSSSFNNRYDNADESGDYNCEEDEEFEIDVETKKDDTPYKYLIMCVVIEDEDGDDFYLTPVIVNLKEGTSDVGDGSSNDGATTSRVGLTNVKNDPNDHVITFVSPYKGQVTVTIEAGETKSVLKTMDVNKDVKYEFNYDDIANIENILKIMSDGEPVMIYLQLTTSDETYKKVAVPIVE